MIAAVDSDAGSPALVSPGTSAWVTMIAGTLAAMAASNGTRSRPRRVSMSETLSGALWGSVVPEPMPGQCFTTGVIPAWVIAGMIAVT